MVLCGVFVVCTHGSVIWRFSLHGLDLTERTAGEHALVSYLLYIFVNGQRRAIMCHVVYCRIQMVQRILIMFMPAKYQPDYMFLRNVPLRRVHLFTIIQLVFFVIMWVLEKIKITSLLFPLMVSIDVDYFLTLPLDGQYLGLPNSYL